MNYDQKYSAYLEKIEQALSGCCAELLPETSRVCQAARYSLLAGGKRVRAILTLAACELLGGNEAAALRFACAVEMLHCYSLIHDDLPCMDNDDMRRGKPSCHKAFGEATALLAGDALLTEAFEAIASAPACAETKARAALALAAGAGSKGMVWGQEMDLRYEGQPVSEETLRLIHANKTGALINAAVQLGAAAALAGEPDCSALRAYALDLGLVFQIVDDVLDVTSTSEELGKPAGSDASNEKTTFATLYGSEGARELARSINESACSALRAGYGEKADFLVQLAETLLCRRS
ncbi:polyprenyl synthetase family protein [Allofournierella sp.]|uniref:polyprenyl synthetase family protein n=1 Tax=Allofournierella sp. TaxID=1940256 RepID=UPI003AB3DEB5